MKPQPEQSTQEVLAGLDERVTYHNEENGFCVLRIKARGHRDLVTVIGHSSVVSAGEWVTASGEWINDRTHGQQFKARFLKTSAPTSLDGVEKFLASGMIRGIGPVYAKKLVRAFGETAFDTIEAEPCRAKLVRKAPILGQCDNAEERVSLMKICVIGAGAIDGLLAATLAPSGERVSVITRGAPLASIVETAFV